MSRYSRSVLAAVAIAAVATLAACNTPATSGPAADPSVGGTTQTQAAAPKPALPTNGKCVLITTDKAAALVGSSVTSSSSNATGGDGIARVDGCTFIGASSNLGYDINDLSGSPMKAAAVVAQAKAAMTAQAEVTPFDVTGGDSSVAFTMAIGPKVMARIEAAKGPYTIGVNSTAPDAETAKKISTGALALLLAAVG